MPTGLFPDLVRAWEKRYAVVAPIRGPRGARLYTAADIAHLCLLASVVATGRASGDIAALRLAELARPVAPSARDRRDTIGDENGSTPREHIAPRILEPLQRFGHAAVADLLCDAVVGLGTRTFVRGVAAPIAHHVGARWAEGAVSIAEEHLLTGMLREIAVVQRAPSADVELWLGGADADWVAARIAAFHGMVVDHLSDAENELSRIAVAASFPA